MARATNLSSTATMTGQEPLSPFGFAVDLALPRNDSLFAPLTFPIVAVGQDAASPFVNAGLSENLGNTEIGTGGHTTKVAGNAITLDTDRDLTPTMTVNAANPANVTFTVVGLVGDEHGTVTFTDANGLHDVVPIASNSTYSANLSNLADGTLTYLLSVTDPAGNLTTLDPTAMLGDGSANAPPGPPELPSLFAGYAVRPPWMVAGVDYAVGIPRGTVLTDWESLTGPGISIQGNLVRIDNTNGVHISNVDFSLHGGANLYINNSNDTVVTNCKFQSYTTADIIQFAGSSSGLTVNYSDITGGSNGSGLIGATGNVVVQYNWMNNFPQHAVELYGSASLDMRYNLIENGGTVSGSHLNYVQLMGVGITDSLLVEFNTTYQTPQTASGEGFQFDINDGTSSGTLVNPTFAYNTMIATGGAPGSAMSYMVHGSSKVSTSNPRVTPIDGTATVHDNYFVASGAYGAFFPGSLDGWSVSNNIDMANGNTINADDSESTTSTSTATVPAAPSITSFSPDTGSVAGFTDANVLTAEAGDVVKINNGAMFLGTTPTNSSGAWSYTTSPLATGSHALTATVTDVAGNTSAASQAVNDTIAPAAPPPGPCGNPFGNPLANIAALLGQYMSASNDQGGASISTPPVVAQSTPAPVTLVSPFGLHR